VSEFPEIDTSVAHGARTYDYWLSGNDNDAADRVLGDLIRERIPTISTMALANREFLTRAVRYLAREAGIRQFLDIGTGIPPRRTSTRSRRRSTLSLAWSTSTTTIANRVVHTNRRLQSWQLGDRPRRRTVIGSSGIDHSALTCDNKLSIKSRACLTMLGSRRSRRLRTAVGDGLVGRLAASSRSRSTP
jgi:hypothetical protein